MLGVHKKCSLNAHGTLLPRHRGVFGSWWTLYSRDNEGGATIHTMELKLDAGENVHQESFPVQLGDTQYSIAFMTKGLLAKGSVAVLKKLDNGGLKFLPKTFESSYHRAPSHVEGLNFTKKGYRIVKAKDIRYVLSNHSIQLNRKETNYI